MRTSIATVSVSGSLTEKLEAVARAGFDGVEIFENDLLGCPLSPIRSERERGSSGSPSTSTSRSETSTRPRPTACGPTCAAPSTSSG